MIALEDISIDTEFENRHRPLSEDERFQLSSQISQYGFREPLVVWQHHGILLDGHNRLAIWKETSDKNNAPDVVEYKFKTRGEALEWIDKNQRARRNLTKNEVSVMQGREYREAKKPHGAKKGNSNASKNKGDTVSPLNESTSKALSEKHGVSSRQIKRDAQFSQAVDVLETNIDESHMQALLSDKPPISRKVAVEISKLPEQEQEQAFKTESKKTPKPKQKEEPETKKHSLPTRRLVNSNKLAEVSWTIGKAIGELKKDDPDLSTCLELLFLARRMSGKL